MFRILDISSKCILGCGGALALRVPLQSAHAQGYSVLYNFCSQLNCADGGRPNGPLVVDSQGNLFGTTLDGGAYGSSCYEGSCGVVFKLGAGGSYSLLHSFSGGSSDGAAPDAGVIEDSQGNLFGTTTYGGEDGDGGNHGTIFEISADNTESILSSICSKKGSLCGGGPGGLTLDDKGDLYGTTFYSGDCHEGLGCGAVFKLTPTRHLKVVFSFQGSNGANPQNNWSDLFAGNRKYFYGSTSEGGKYGVGTVFKIAPNGTETVLYNFCPQTKCSDGSAPRAGLVQDSRGNLYGTTDIGGEATACVSIESLGCGVVFKLAPPAKGLTKWTESVLYAFSGGSDGSYPNAGLDLDSQGNLYGTTNAGGTGGGDEDGCKGCGVVFKVAPNGTESVLYNFCSQTDCVDGSGPYTGLITDGKGNLYGTTNNGGNGPGAGGVVFTIAE